MVIGYDSPEAAHQHLKQQATSATSLAEAQALLAEALARQEALLLENRQLHVAQQEVASRLEDAASASTPGKQAGQQIRRLQDEPAQCADDKYHTLFNAIDDGFCLFEVLYDEQGPWTAWCWKSTRFMSG